MSLECNVTARRHVIGVLLWRLHGCEARVMLPNREMGRFIDNDVTTWRNGLQWLFQRNDRGGWRSLDVVAGGAGA